MAHDGPWGFLEKTAHEVGAVLTLVVNHLVLGHVEHAAALWRTALRLSHTPHTREGDKDKSEAERWLVSLLQHSQEAGVLWSHQHFTAAVPSSSQVRYALSRLTAGAPDPALLDALRLDALKESSAKRTMGSFNLGEADNDERYEVIGHDDEVPNCLRILAWSHLLRVSPAATVRARLSAHLTGLASVSPHSVAYAQRLYCDALVIDAFPLGSTEPRAVVQRVLSSARIHVSDPRVQLFLTLLGDSGAHVGGLVLRDALDLVYAGATAPFTPASWHELCAFVAHWPSLASLMQLLAAPVLAADASARLTLADALHVNEAPVSVQDVLIRAAEREHAALRVLAACARSVVLPLRIGSRVWQSSHVLDILAHLSRTHSLPYVLQNLRGALSAEDVHAYLHQYAPQDAALCLAWLASQSVVEAVTGADACTDAVLRMRVCAAAVALSAEAALAWLQSLYALVFVLDSHGDFVLSSWKVLGDVVGALDAALSLLPTSREVHTMQDELRRVQSRVKALGSWPRTPLPWLFATDEALVVRALRVRDWDTAHALLQSESTRVLVVALQRFQTLLADLPQSHVNLSLAERVDLALSLTCSASHAHSLIGHEVTTALTCPAVHSWVGLTATLIAPTTLAEALCAPSYTNDPARVLALRSLAALVHAHRTHTHLARLSRDALHSLPRGALLWDVADYLTTMREVCARHAELHTVVVDHTPPDTLLARLALEMGAVEEATRLAEELHLALVPTVFESLPADARVSIAFLAHVAVEAPLHAVLAELQHTAPHDVAVPRLLTTARTLHNAALTRLLDHKTRLLHALEQGDLGITLAALRHDDLAFVHSLTSRLVSLDSDMAREFSAARALSEALAVRGHALAALQCGAQALNGGASDVVRGVVAKLRVTAAHDAVQVLYALRGLREPVQQATLMVHHLEQGNWSLPVALDLIQLAQARLQRLIAHLIAPSPVAHPLQHSLNLSAHVADAEVALQRVQRWAQLLKAYSLVCKTLPVRWRTWSALHTECTQSLGEVMSELSAHELFDTAADLARLHAASPAILMRIEEQALLALLSRAEAAQVDYAHRGHPLLVTIVQRLRTVHHSRLPALCPRLLVRITHTQSRLFIIRTVRALLAEVQDADYDALLNELRDHETALAMLEVLPSELQRSFGTVLVEEGNEGVPMHERTLRLLESLLMSELTQHVASMLQHVPALKASSLATDALFLHYASKAIFDSLPTSSSGTTTMDPGIDAVDVDERVIDEHPELIALASGSLPRVNAFRAAREFRLCGPESEVSNQRRSHRFTATPRPRLATAFLELCQDSHGVVVSVLRWCDVLSERLQRVASDRLVHVHVIEALLHYAKRRALTDPSLTTSAADLEECDTYLARVSLLQQLFMSSVELGSSLTLASFSDPHKCRLLRDRLIELDHVALAIEVAGKCNIESDPAWAHWGLALLRMGRYAEAKEKFSHCLVPSASLGQLQDIKSPSHSPTKRIQVTTINPQSSPGGRLYSPAPAAAISIGSGSAARNRLVLQRILRVLESGTPPDPAHLRGRYHELRKEVHKAQKAQKKGEVYGGDASMDVDSYMRALGKTPPPPSQKPSITQSFLSLFAPKQAARLKNPLDSARYMQAVYYLQHYGTQEDLIGFWLRHHLLEDAIRYIFAQKLNSAAFVQVVVHALTENQLPRLKEVLLRLDPKLGTFRRYLTAACRHFYQSQMLTVLLDLQLFMGDFLRAGRTCIKLFMRAQTYEEQRLHLEAAKEHFLKALSTLNAEWESSGSSGVSEESEKDEGDEALHGASAIAAVSSYLKQINLQLEISSFAQTTPGIPSHLLASASGPATSLFGDFEQKRSLAELVVLHGNYDLAFRLVQECQLSAPEIYAKVLERLAEAKDTAAMQSLLRSVHGTMSEDDSDGLIQQFVGLLTSQLSDLRTAELWAAKISSPALRVRAYISCMKLKLAYMDAVKIGDTALVSEVRDAALKWGMAREAELCEQYLLQGFSGM